MVTLENKPLTRVLPRLDLIFLYLPLSLSFLGGTETQGLL